MSKRRHNPDAAETEAAYHHAVRNFIPRPVLAPIGLPVKHGKASAYTFIIDSILDNGTANDAPVQFDVEEIAKGLYDLAGSWDVGSVPTHLFWAEVIKHTAYREV